jgi:hypothetical protein
VFDLDHPKNIPTAVLLSQWVVIFSIRTSKPVRRVSMKNINTFDRFLRILAGVVLLELSYFWMSGVMQWVIAGVGIVLLATATMRFCPLYRVLGLSSTKSMVKAWSVIAVTAAAVALAAVLFGGSFASAFFSRKVFLEEFNAMNHFYKQTLFLTGKNEREKAILNFDKLLNTYGIFQEKYTAFQPYALKSDARLKTDLARVAQMLAQVEPLVRKGDLHQAHLDLEQVRPVFQDVFKRNGFSLLAVSLVDFHDAMELILDAANAKDAFKLISLYPQVSEKLKAVEAEANDAEIQTIRKNLDDLHALAANQQTATMPTKADELKSSFVKVYLKRG